MKFYLETKDYSVSKETFELYQDQDLDMLVTKPVPENLYSYYESDNYISHTDAKKSIIDKTYQIIKRRNLKSKLNIVKKFSNGKSILDVGAGTGDFLVEAKNQNFTVNGVEPNVNASLKAQEKNIELKPSLEAFENQKFDIITLWHVLEHLPNLNDQVTRLRNLLNENGVLIIAVPNYKSYDAVYYKKHWAAFDVPRHLWHFSKTSIIKLFKKEKLELQKVYPMVFDSFYVSLLSENYKTGKQNYFKAFWIGLLSNIKAWRNKEYSSLIYVLKRPK